MDEFKPSRAERGRAAGLALLFVVALLGACQQKQAAPPPAQTPADAYLAPPRLISATDAGGGIRLTGQAPAGAVARLRSTDGGQVRAPADPKGVWTTMLPPASTPRLYAFEALLNGRVIRGEGALAVMPQPTRVPGALILRAGFAAIAPGAAPAGALILTALDYDGGGVAASGFGPAGSPVRLTVDGQVVGVSQVDPAGRYAILAVAASHSLALGHRVVRVETPQGLAVQRALDITTPTVDPGQVFAAESADYGWKITWRLPDGGVQTSLVFDQAQRP